MCNGNPINTGHQQTDPPDQEPKANPLQQLLPCIVHGLVAALPTFTDAFTKCMASKPDDPDGYQPGDRTRCE